MKDRSHLITENNPMGTDGFEFIEFVAADPGDLITLFEGLGFEAYARHKTRAVTLYKQGDINLLVNADPDSSGKAFFDIHGPCACSFGIRVADADYALKRAMALGAEQGESEFSVGGQAVPCIKGIGDSLLYLVDRYEGDDGQSGSMYDDDFELLHDADYTPKGFGLELLDHITHNVQRGNMDRWAGFYEKLFNFREIRFFDIEGKMTGLKSRALTSPCGKVKIPINESSDDKSQIAEYLEQYNGEGIQHIALAAKDIYSGVDRMRADGVPFLSAPPDTYYEMLPERLPEQNEDINELKSRALLVDGETGGGRILLQIFTEPVIGPIFFEIIQRKGDEGFGEGNFKALFESMERDQIRRGVLKEA